MSIELETIPLGAVLLIEADFSRYVDYSLELIYTLWQYTTGDEGKYLIKTNSALYEESSEDVINWINDVLSLEPHEYIAHNDTCIITLREELMELIND